jgi:hypothetical protein
MALYNEFLKRPIMKNCVCLNWYRGVCIYKRSECHFAHGFEDLDLDPEKEFNKDQLNKFQEPLKIKGKRLYKNLFYTGLYKY